MICPYCLADSGISVYDHFGPDETGRQDSYSIDRCMRCERFLRVEIYAICTCEELTADDKDSLVEDWCLEPDDADLVASLDGSTGPRATAPPTEAKSASGDDRSDGDGEDE